MSTTISNIPGDGTFQANIELLDSGTSAIVQGALWPGATGNPNTETAMTGSPITTPTPPGAGLVYWIIQVDTLTVPGAVSVKQSTVAMPVSDAGNILIFQQTLAPGNTDPALVATDVTPDQ